MKIEDVVAACHRDGIPRVFISLNAATNCSCGHRPVHNILSVHYYNMAQHYRLQERARSISVCLRQQSGTSDSVSR